MREYTEDHVYEVEPRLGDKRALMIEASKGKGRGKDHDTSALLRSAVAFAVNLLEDPTLHPEWDDDPAWTSMGIYHTYPKAGPVRRYVGEVKDGRLVRPA